MHVKTFATKRPKEESFAWDTDGLPFVVDNSDIAIICNVRKLFTGKLIATKIMLETTEGTSASTKLVDIIRLVLTYDKNEHNIYNIPGCIYNPDSPLNILGIPALGKKFNDGANINNPLDNDGTTVKAGAMKSHFVWDHGRRKRHFMHRDSHMLELHLYVGHGYFNTFCMHIHNVVGENFHYAFSSAFSVNPHTKQKDNVPTKPTIISYDHGKLDDEEPLHKYCNPATK